jgi:hypothetical protein
MTRTQHSKKQEINWSCQNFARPPDKALDEKSFLSDPDKSIYYSLVQRSACRTQSRYRTISKNQKPHIQHEGSVKISFAKPYLAKRFNELPSRRLALLTFNKKVTAACALM